MDPNTSPGLILLVDDEPLVLAAGVQLLRSLGFDVLVARDGEQAVAVFERRFAELSAVVSDIVMPKMSGLEAARRMAAIAPEVPIILMSGFVGEEHAAEVIPLGHTVLGKPFRRAELAATLNRLARSLPTAPSAAVHD